MNELDLFVLKFEQDRTERDIYNELENCDFNNFEETNERIEKIIQNFESQLQIFIS